MSGEALSPTLADAVGDAPAFLFPTVRGSPRMGIRHEEGWRVVDLRGNNGSPTFDTLDQVEYHFKVQPSSVRPLRVAHRETEEPRETLAVDELPHSDSMSFEQLCRAAAWQLVSAFDQSYELDDDTQKQVEEALTLALIARPASLDALTGTNVLPDGLIEMWDEEAEGKEDS